MREIHMLFIVVGIQIHQAQSLITCPPQKLVINDFEVVQFTTVMQPGGSGYDHQATVTWNDKFADAGFDGFYVRIINATDNLRLFDDFVLEPPCVPAEEYIYTKTPSYTFHNLLFGGYRYKVWVKLHNSTTNVTTSLPAEFTFVTPDCLDSTDNEKYCQTQPVESTGKIRDFYAECRSANVYRNQTNVVMTWLPPIQINGVLDYFSIGWKKSESTGGFEVIRRLEVNNLKENFTQRFFVVGELLPNVSYEVEIVPHVKNESSAGLRFKANLTSYVVEYANDTDGTGYYCVVPFLNVDRTG